MFCLECIKPCELHGMDRCATCHKHPGECGIGACEELATHALEHPQETRIACETHATDPTWACVRVGYTVREGVSR